MAEITQAGTGAVDLWSIQGYDKFDGTSYLLEGTYATEVDAVKAARSRLAQLEEMQPSERSGGQGADGIQDRVYVVRPDGSRYRFLG